MELMTCINCKKEYPKEVMENTDFSLCSEDCVENQIKFEKGISKALKELENEL